MLRTRGECFRERRHHHRSAKHRAYALRELSAIQSILLHSASSKKNTMSMGAIMYRVASVRKHCDAPFALAKEFAMCEKMCENLRSEEITCHPHNQFLGNQRLSAFLKF